MARKARPPGELATHIGELHAAARAARPRAHAPYSRFQVGAAVLDERARVFAGCNVENAAYPQGWCAEASALAAMVLAGGRRVHAVAVVAQSAELTTPCGGCRQKLAEFAGPQCEVHVLGPRGVRRVLTLGELLPFGFGEGHLPGATQATGPAAKPAAKRAAKPAAALAKKAKAAPAGEAASPKPRRLSRPARAARPSAAPRRRG